MLAYLHVMVQKLDRVAGVAYNSDWFHQINQYLSCLYSYNMIKSPICFRMKLHLNTYDT